MKILKVKEIKDDKGKLVSYTAIFDNQEITIPLIDGEIGTGNYRTDLAEHIANGGKVSPQFTNAELEDQLLEQSKIDAQAYLDNTDWIDNKYTDVVTISGTMTKTAFKAKYATEIAKRANARKIINGGA